MSRVVPGVSLTIATWRWARKFIKVDFPAFGGPKIDNFRPSLIVSPILAQSICILITSASSLALDLVY